MNKRLIDRDVFFGNPEIAAGQLSPDGKYISFMKAHNGIMNLWVKPFNEDFSEAKLLTKSTSPVLGYFWTYDSKYMLFVNDSGGDENLNVFMLSPFEDGLPDVTNLTNYSEVRAQIHAVSKENPDVLWVGINDRDKAWHDLYKLTISDRKMELMFENHDRIVGWEFDWDEKIRLAYRTDENGFTEILKVGDDFSSFENIYTTNLQESASVAGWSEDNSKFYLISNKGDVDLSTLYLVDFDSLEMEKIESDPDGIVDISGISLHRHTRELLVTEYVDDQVRRYWRNKEWESMFEGFHSHFPNREINIVSSTLDYSGFLLTTSGDKYASEVYHYDVERKKYTFQYVLRSALKEVEGELSEMKPIQYKSSDGLLIRGYLTLPKGISEDEQCPLVVFVHGGPKGPRDHWGYRSDVQFLANRGYAVLQPNFRASGGYGKAFLNAGDGEWGRLMQDDITWGVKYLIEEAIVDKNRVAIMGGSYGGYATLAGLAFTPDVYACGVDIVGPSNIFTLLESIPPYWEAGRKWLYEMTGDPETEEGKAMIKASSPLFHVDKMKKPLLIVQGANDPRVKQQESDQIVEVLQEKGHDVSYLLAMDEGHGFRKPLNRKAMFVEIERFFHKHLGGRLQEEVSDDVLTQLEMLKVH